MSKLEKTLFGLLFESLAFVTAFFEETVPFPYLNDIIDNEKSMNTATPAECLKKWTDKNPFKRVVVLRIILKLK